MPSAFPVFDALPRQGQTSPFDALPASAPRGGDDGIRPAPARTDG
jgi:hypothetical protein